MNFQEAVANRPAPVKDVALRLRELIFSIDPNLTETISDHNDVRVAMYSQKRPTNVIFSIQCAPDTCRLYLHQAEHINGGKLKLERNGRSLRYIAIDKPEHIDRPELKQVMVDVYCHHQ